MVAIGVAFIIDMIGEIIASDIGNTVQSVAKSTPKTIPTVNPTATLKREFSIRRKNPSDTISFKSAARVSFTLGRK